MKNNLVWHEESQKNVYSCPIFSISERLCRSPKDKPSKFMVLDTADWAIVIPIIKAEQGNQFVMVRQWRHGAKELSLEFPGGVFEKDEDDISAAKRELKEETGYTAGIITKLGKFNPNPAIMSNNVHFFLAEDLTGSGIQNLDPNEFVNIENVLLDDVLAGMGKPPFIHALMGTACFLYLQYKKIKIKKRLHEKNS